MGVNGIDHLKYTTLASWMTDYSQKQTTADNMDAESADMWNELDALEAEVLATA